VLGAAGAELLLPGRKARGGYAHPRTAGSASTLRNNKAPRRLDDREVAVAIDSRSRPARPEPVGVNEGNPMNATDSSFERAATASASTSCGGRIRKPGSSSIAPVCRTGIGSPTANSLRRQLRNPAAGGSSGAGDVDLVENELHSVGERVGAPTLSPRDATSRAKFVEQERREIAPRSRRFESG
jgi:hypothetical protein